MAGQFVVRNGQTVQLGATDLQVGDIVCNATLEVARGNITPSGGNGVTDGNLPFVDGCVPLNLFGAGAATPEAVAFIQGQQTFQSELEQEVYQINIGTDLFELPAGPVAIALGYQHREESGFFDSDEFATLGLGRSAPIADTGGQFNTEEFFGEIFIPVLGAGDVPFINALSIEARGRVVENSIAGTDSTYTVGGRINTVGDFRIAGAYTQSIRAPSIVELFAPITQVFATGNDPCDNRFINEGPDPAVRRANCIAAGITDPDNFVSNIVNATGVGSSGGNPNLENEIAQSYTIGIAWTPSYIRGLTFSVDYLNIDIEQRIAALTLTQTFEACFDAVDFPSDFCNNFVRDADGQVVDFQTGQANASSSTLDAVSFNLNYDTTLSDFVGLVNSDWRGNDWGVLGFGINGIRRISNDFQILPGVEPNEVIGSFFEPEWSFNFDTTYALGRFSFNWRTQFQSRIILDPDGEDLFEVDGELIEDVGNRWLHNGGVAYEIVDGLVARVTVNNIFNRRGSEIDRASGNIGFAEILGRQYLFNMRWAF